MKEEETIRERVSKSSKPLISKNIVKIIFLFILVVIIILIVIITWSWLTSYKGCDTWECFNEELSACSRTKFAGGTDILFGYTIKGKTNEYCEIDVELLQGELTVKDASKLSEQKMTCLLTEGIVMLPEADLSNCHGPLKEKLQEQVITQLHNYIIQNLGHINKNLLNPLAIKDNQTE
jgi:hypothetical protein